MADCAFLTQKIDVPNLSTSSEVMWSRGSLGCKASSSLQKAHSPQTRPSQTLYLTVSFRLSFPPYSIFSPALLNKSSRFAGALLETIVLCINLGEQRKNL